MRKPPAVLASFVALVALVLGAASCGSVEATAATVNGHRISRDTVDTELRQIRDNKAYRQALGLGKIEGSGKGGTFDAEFAAQVVTLQIYYELVDEELDRRNITISDKDMSAARTSAETSLGSDPQTGQGGADAAAKGKKVLDGFSRDYQETLVRREAAVAKLSDALSKTDTSDAALQKYYDEHKDQYTEVCAKHVLVDTKEAADAVAAQLRGGADFATIAKAQSKDPSAAQNGGDLGCELASSYVAEFQRAVLAQPLNQIGDPVQSQFGWHVVLVMSRTPKPFADVKDQIRQQVGASSGSAVNDWLVSAIKKAKISVDKRFGTFDRTPASGQLPRVVPPASATSTTAPAVTPTTGR
jgi:parvulin-like peptidyl-prolyl isomerase